MSSSFTVRKKEFHQGYGIELKSCLQFATFTSTLTRFLKREGLLQNASYSNAEDTDLFLDKNKRSYMGGILEMSNSRLYKFWDDLDKALATGKLQNEAKEVMVTWISLVSCIKMKLHCRNLWMP